MHAVFFATTAASASSFAAELDFVLFAVGSLEGQLGGTLLLDEEIPRTESNIVKDHKFFRWFGTVGFCS